MTSRKLTGFTKQIEQDLVQIRDQFLINVAEDLVNTTVATNTVDTGAYITSHSITTTRGAGRARSSHNKPTGQDPSAKAKEAMSGLMGDIAALPNTETEIFITNNSPHASVVEYTLGRYILSTVRQNAPEHLQKAINSVGGGR